MDYDNVQVYPARKHITLNDKATKFLFNQTEENYSKLMNGNARGIVEKKHHKKKGEVVSGYRLQNNEGYTNIAPLAEYERDVLDCFLSEYEAGNRIVSLAMIQRALNGRVGDHTDGVINIKQLARLKQAVDKLMCTQYDPDVVSAFETLNYKGADEIRKAPILPCKRIRTAINGKISKEDLVEMYDESPLLKLAKIKGQILTCDSDLYYIPNLNNTTLVTELKHYTFRRVFEIRKHRRNMSPILTLDDIFTKCRIKDASKSTKQDARETLEKIFAHLQSKGEIKSYEWSKKGKSFYSIKITY